MIILPFATHLSVFWLSGIRNLYLCDRSLPFVSFGALILSAEPIVRGQMTHLPEGSVFIYCQVGERA